MSNISYLPSEGLSYDPSEPIYWDDAGLDAEMTRAFEVCHGCRMCFKYCSTFADLFKIIDDDVHDGDVRKVTLDERAHVLDSCFQCKLCEVQCPYTPAEEHEFQLDFPKLVHRYRAQRHREHGSKLRDRVLGDPDTAGKMARMSLGMANLGNKVKLHRWFMEKALGVHRDKLLPEFASKTFSSKARKAGRSFETGGEAVLFATCFVEHNEPHVGEDTLAVLDRNQVDVRVPEGVGCCGMPAWEYGDLDEVRKRARRNLDALLPHVDAGAKVLVVNPTCSMMLRKEYPELLEGEDRERARRLSAATMDVSEYVWSLRKEERFADDFASRPGEQVAYHAPCHLRAQRVGFKGRDLVRKTGAKPKSVIECCGHDGTWAMKTEGFEDSQRWGRKAFEQMAEADAEVWVTDCPLAAIQFQQHAGVKPMHPMSVLARAYEPDGFPTKVEPKEE